MSSNDNSIKLTFHFFTLFSTIIYPLNYISADTSYYYLFDLLLLNYCYLDFLLSSFLNWFLNCSFALNGKSSIDLETFTWVWLQIIFGKYPNRTYGFSSRTGLWKVATRVPVRCSELFASIDCFAWYKISFKLFAQDLFCWLLTIVYHIYWIRVHWSWNLSLGVIANIQWAVSKPYIQICVYHRFLEGRGEGDVFLFHLYPSIHWLVSRQFIKFDNFSWIFGDWFINITE